MKRFLLLPICVFLAMGIACHAEDLSLASLQKCISQGLKYLDEKQDKQTGAWITPEEPGLTGLVLTAHVNDPARQANGEESPATRAGYEYLLKQVKPDGGIYGRGRANYNTSIALTALVLRGHPLDQEVIRKARKFLVGQQTDYGEKGKPDDALDGGFGYGPNKPGEKAHADLSNTQFALEALYLSKKLFEDSGTPVEKKDDLNWDAAIQFVTRCQNLPGSNDQSWAGKDKANIGGFVYEPSGGPPSGGRTALRCYGSISYAGMMSFIYAGLNENDPRVKAAIQWLGENYTLDENPGLGAEGLYYYYHTMAKALAAAHLPSLKTKAGADVAWRPALAQKLLSTQAADGSWANTGSSRWMEGDPVLVTTYTVLALEEIARSLK